MTRLELMSERLRDLLDRPSWQILAVVNDDMANPQDSRQFTYREYEDLLEYADLKRQKRKKGAEDLYWQLKAHLKHSYQFEG